MKNLAVLWKNKTNNPKAPIAKGWLNWGDKRYRIIAWKGRKNKETDPDIVLQLDERQDGGSDQDRGWSDRDVNF
jgi:hypothetical protein